MTTSLLLLLAGCAGPTAPESRDTALELDYRRPTVTVTTPGAATVYGVVPVGAVATDDVGVVTVSFSVDGLDGPGSAAAGVASTDDLAAPWSTSWDTRQVIEGPHSLTATATDAAGNTDSDVVEVWVQNNWDHDGDGYDTVALGGDDCDDVDPTIHPGAAEVAGDGVDQDCDGVDACYVDEDGDNYGTDTVITGSSLDCASGPGAPVDGDCDDIDPTIHPAADDCPDGIDQDCDGVDGSHCPLAGQIEYTGPDTFDYAGAVVSAAGDVNGDGYDDVLTEACISDDACSTAGDSSYAYLVLGSARPRSAALEDEVVYRADGSASDAYGTSELSVSAAGDVDGDGLDDVIIGAYGSSAGWLVLGSASPESGSVRDHVAWTGETADDWAGYAVDGAGDVDGDGLDDVAIVAARAGGTGAVYVVPGSGEPQSESLTLASRSWWGAVDLDNQPRSVAGVGDVDGDGLDDVLIGAPYANGTDGSRNAGAAYLELGRVLSASSALSAADAVYDGTGVAQTAGAVAGAGDVDGDGHADLVISGSGSYYDGPGPQAFLVLGGPTPTSSGLSLASAQYTGSGCLQPGCTVAGAGDVDGDGFDDLLVGNRAADGSNAGKAYVVVGSPAPASEDLASAHRCFYGESDTHSADVAGSSVAGAGDVNDDGYADLLIGAPGASGEYDEEGAAYLILGDGT